MPSNPSTSSAARIGAAWSTSSPAILFPGRTTGATARPKSPEGASRSPRSTRGPWRAAATLGSSSAGRSSTLSARSAATTSPGLGPPERRREWGRAVLLERERFDCSRWMELLQQWRRSVPRERFDCSRWMELLQQWRRSVPRERFDCSRWMELLQRWRRSVPRERFDCSRWMELLQQWRRSVPRARFELLAVDEAAHAVASTGPAGRRDAGAPSGRWLGSRAAGD